MSLNVVTLLASHNHCRFDSTLRRLIALIREMGIGMNVNCHGFTRKSHICSSWFSTVELFRFWVTYLVLLITGLGLASRRSFAGLLVGSLSSHKLKGSIRAVPHRRGCIGSMAAPIRRTQMSRPVPSRLPSIRARAANWRGLHPVLTRPQNRQIRRKMRQCLSVSFDHPPKPESICCCMQLFGQASYTPTAEKEIST